MWTVIHIAQSMENAQKVIELLEKRNILCRIRKFSGKANYYEVLVTSNDLDAAQIALIS